MNFGGVDVWKLCWSRPSRMSKPSVLEATLLCALLWTYLGCRYWLIWIDNRDVGGDEFKSVYGTLCPDAKPLVVSAHGPGTILVKIMRLHIHGTHGEMPDGGCLDGHHSILILERAFDQQELSGCH